MNDIINTAITLEHTDEYLNSLQKAEVTSAIRLGIAVVVGLCLLFASKYNQIIAPQFVYAVLGAVVIWIVIAFYHQCQASKALFDFTKLSAKINTCLTLSDLTLAKKIQSQLHLIGKQTPYNSLITAYVNSNRADIDLHINTLEFEQYQVELTREYELSKQQLMRQMFAKLSKHPLKKLKAKLNSTLEKLIERRAELQKRWDDTYATLSWWNKLKSDAGPDFCELDNHIFTLNVLNKRFDADHGDDLLKVRTMYYAKYTLAVSRLSKNYDLVANYVETLYLESRSNGVANRNASDLLRFGAWAGTFGLSYSIWDDFMTTHAVYDALRSVNGNFEGMSDSDIWFETLWMSHDSLVGLTSLVKGAYFEQLVAMDTQGDLFEHFNHPDTDIIIDGVAFQLKATDSVSYINSVDADIPVIATSEVAEQTDAIDSGFTNFELSADVDTAIDGMGVDVGDAMADGILAGLGGLGFFATINGINHAGARYDAGTPAEDAILQGLGVAVEGTAKTIVDASEMAYKVVSSRPSRAVGRAVGRTAFYILDKIDKKMADVDPNNKNNG